MTKTAWTKKDEELLTKLIKKVNGMSCTYTYGGVSLKLTTQLQTILEIPDNLSFTQIAGDTPGIGFGGCPLH